MFATKATRVRILSYLGDHKAPDRHQVFFLSICNLCFKTMVCGSFSLLKQVVKCAGE